MANEFGQEDYDECSCGRLGARKEYRCYECFQLDLVCSECLKDQHKFMPFHWGQKWNRRFFEKLDLSLLGYEINLGHRETVCPEVLHRNATAQYSAASDQTREPARRFTVAHVNGIHQCKINYCECLGRRESYLQLLEFGIFSSSKENPRLGFTFATLKDFEAHNNASKKSAHDYLDVLRRKTNNFLPDEVAVCYAQGAYAYC